MAEAMDMVNVADVVAPFASASFTVNEVIPAAVGVPDNVPPADSVKPPGNDPESRDQVYGVVPPVPSNTELYGAPVIPLGTEAVLIFKAVVEAATLTLTVAASCPPNESVT